MNIIADCSHYIHLLQIERGTSATYLKGGFSKSRLSDYRRDTDAEKANFLARIEEHSPDPASRKSLVATAEKVADMRRLVDQGKSVGEVVGGFPA